jgi:hypothetical protein
MVVEMPPMAFGHSEHIGWLGEANPAVGDYGHDALLSGLVDADPPRRAPRELLAGDEPVAQPPVDGHLAHVEETFGFLDGDQDGSVAGGCRGRGTRGRGVYASVLGCRIACNCLQYERQGSQPETTRGA